MHSYVVGEIIPQLKSGGDLVQMGYTDGLWELRIGFPAITQEEIQELQFGDFRMATVCIKESLFFLFSIGRIPWCDTPYEPRLVTPQPEFSLDYEKGKGAPLLLLIVDTSTGVLKGLRMLGLGELLTIRLHSICADLNQNRPLNVELYKADLKRIYEQYPTSVDMLDCVNPADVFMLLNESS